MKKDPSLNVFGEKLSPCSQDPVTGFFRDGCCNTCEQDTGSHTVCIEASSEFLQYSRFRGNDLSTPVLEVGFSGLKAGDNWCLCAARWLEAHKYNMAPKLKLASTHQKAVDIVPLALMKKYASDLN